MTLLANVEGCDSYGLNCDDNPIYLRLPRPGYDDHTFPKIDAVVDRVTLVARCYAHGGVTYNWDTSKGDRGPSPYSSDVYYEVRVSPATGMGPL